MSADTLTSTSTSPEHVLNVLNAEYPVTDEMKESFRTNGFIKLSRVLSPELLSYYEDHVTRLVLDIASAQHEKTMEERSTYEKAFLQAINLWLRDPVVSEFVHGKRLARIATELLGVSGVRLYHDQGLYKEPGGGITPWHVDQYYWPLGPGSTVTAWIPFQETPAEMGPLTFKARSQHITDARGLAISEDSEAAIAANEKLAALETFEEPFSLGDVSFHGGWTYHRASPNRSQAMRRVMTVIFIEDGMQVSEPQVEEHRFALDMYFPGKTPGEAVGGELHPLVYAAG